jgi:hypothetical protein
MRLPRRVVIAVLGLGVFGVGLLGAVQGRHWLALDGTDWTAMDAAERAAWTQGFLAGRALGQVSDSLANDTLALARELDRMRQSGAFAFNFAPPLYTNRLGDFYFWENHRPLPLWRAMLDVNRELQSGER